MILYVALSGVWDNIRDNWLGPLFLILVAFMAFMCIKDRSWMKLLGLVGIAAVAGILIWWGQDLIQILGRVGTHLAGQIESSGSNGVSLDL